MNRLCDGKSELRIGLLTPISWRFAFWFHASRSIGSCSLILSGDLRGNAVSSRTAKGFNGLSCCPRVFELEKSLRIAVHEASFSS